MGHVHRLIAFDLDGTLIDSSRDLADSANALIAALGGRTLPESAIVDMVGEGAAMLVRRALAAATVPEPADALPRFLELYEARLLAHTRPYPGIVDAVRAAKEHGRVAVLTNKPKGPSERILCGLGMRELFDDVVGGDGPLPRKPDPAALVALMDAAGATPETTMLVGDSPIDFRTAVNARVHYCIAGFGFGFGRFTAEDRLPSDAVARDAQEIAERIRRFATSSTGALR